jgi:hypothetical protein
LECGEIGERPKAKIDEIQNELKVAIVNKEEIA